MVGGDDTAGRGAPLEGSPGSPADAARAILHPSLASLPIGIIVADAGLFRVRSNPAASAILGIPAGVNVAGRKGPPAWTVFARDEPIPPERLPLARALRGEEIRGEEHDLVFASGSWTPILVTAFPLREGGRTAAAVCSIEDLSRVKEAERRLEIQRRKAIEESVVRNGRLSVTFHDIRSSLTASTLLAELLAHLSVGIPDEGEIHKLAGDVKGSLATILDQVEEAVRLAKATAVQEAPQSEFQLGAFIFQEGKHHFAEARSRGIRLEIRPPPVPLRIRTDRDRLAHLVGSILRAAIRGTRSGWVRLSARAGDGGPILLVEDTGSGIAVDDGIRTEGSWISPVDAGGETGDRELALWRKILEPVAGTISVERTPGAGSVHSIGLDPSTVVPAGGGEEPEAGPVRPAGTPGKETRSWWL